MTDISAVGSSSLDTWSASLDDDERRAASAPTTKAAPTRDLSELPELPDANAGLLARAARAASTPRPLLATGLASADVANVDSATTPAPTVQRRLDAFRAAATPMYHLPDGTDVTVAAPFRMPARQERDLTPAEKTDDTTARYAAVEGRVDGHKAELAAIASKVGIGPGGLVALYNGRGTPQQVHALTQALLNAGKLPVGDDKPADRVRRMMCDYGLGFDCAGYTQQAFLSARGLTRAQAGFTDPTNEGLFAPSPAHFTRVAPKNANAGDIVVLGPPEGETVGHRAVVADRHELTAAELQRLGCTGPERALLAAGHVTVFSVDSSWGSSADPSQGGVERHTWLYDSTTGLWGTVGAGDAGTVRLSALPYGNHPLRGIYHYAGSP
jgi:hypothetical protein